MNRVLEGKTAAISGGAGGIGKDIVLALAKEGANIVLITHNIKAAEDLLLEVKKFGVDGIYIQCEITDEKQVEMMVQKTVETFGSLDIAINNAGVGTQAPVYPLLPVSELTETNWDQFMNNSLKGVFFSMKQELMQMQKQGFGVVINTSFEGLNPRANCSLYYSAKAGVVAMSQCAALENQAHGIRVNVVCSDPNANTAEKSNEKIKNEEIANMVCWLCSSSASSITGSVLNPEFKS